MANGNLNRRALASVPQGGLLRKDAARAYNALNRYCLTRHGQGLRHAGDGATYRRLGRPGDYARGGAFTQWYAWERYQQGGNLAASPGTSNHGLGAACDFVTIDLVRNYGSKFGWRKTEGFSEPWHYCYVAGNYEAVAYWSQVHTGDVMRYGDKGSGVRSLKILLRRHGRWSYPSMGSTFGVLTSRAVKRFQRANGLQVDGVVGKGTWRLLRKPKGAVK